MQDVTIPTENENEIESETELYPKRVDMTFDDLVKHVERRRDTKTLGSVMGQVLLPFERSTSYKAEWRITPWKQEVYVFYARGERLAITQDGELVPDWRKRLMKFWFSTMNGLEQLKKIYLVAKMNYKTDVHISFEDALEPMVDYCTKYSEELTLKNNFGVATDMCTEAVFNVVNRGTRSAEKTKQAILNLLESRIECFQLQSALTEETILSEIREEYHPLVRKDEMEKALRELKNEGKVMKLTGKFDYWEAVK